MLTVAASGTLTGQAIGTENDLFDIPSGWTYVPVVDLTNMQLGDAVTVTIYDTVIATGALRVAYRQTFNDVQTQAAAYGIPVPVSHGGRFTLNQTAGTPRNFDREVRQL